MKARKRILDIRKHSEIAPSNENLWFFSENSSNNQSFSSQRKSTRNDHLSILKEDYNRQGPDSKAKSRKECPFIVDWQMSDAF
jgi:hypothetical protein